MRHVALAAPAGVGASQTNTPVSQPFGLTAAASLNFECRVGFSALVATAGVSGKLQHTTGDGVWRDVGSEAAFTCSQQAQSLGDIAVLSILAAATDDLTQGDGVLLTVTVGEAATTFALWVDIDEDGTEPSGSWYTNADYQIPISVETDGTVADTVAAIVASYGDFTDLSDAVDMASDADSVTFTALEIGGGTVVSYNEDGGSTGGLDVEAVNAGASRDYIDDDTITSGSNAFATGDRVVVSATELPAGVTSSEAYVIQLDEFTFQLAASQADAYAGLPLTLTGGLGTLVVAKADYLMALRAKDTTDVTQLPLWPSARVVLTTGAGDSGTVSDIIINE